MTRTYNPGAGMHIELACKRLAEIATAANEPAEMDFNGETIRAMPGESGMELAKAFSARSAQQRKNYEDSPEGKASAAAYAERGLRKTVIVKRAFEDLLTATAVNDLQGIVKALITFTEESDHGAVAFDMVEGARRLREAGYVAHEGVDDPEVIAMTNPTKFVRYLAGQAIAFMGSGFSPHRMIGRFGEDWLEKNYPNKEPHGAHQG